MASGLCKGRFMNEVEVIISKAKKETIVSPLIFFMILSIEMSYYAREGIMFFLS